MENIDDNFTLQDALKELSPLVNGMNCDVAASLISPRKSYVYATENDVIDALTQGGRLVFEGRVLRLGIYDVKTGKYKSDDGYFEFSLNESELEVYSICSKSSFKVLNFSKDNNSFGIKFGDTPSIEFALVVNTAKSMQKYIGYLKQMAPRIAENIFLSDSLSKATLVTFSSLNVNDLGTFTSKDEFVSAIKGIDVVDSQTRMVNLSLIKAMQNFTKDNGLDKIVLLITDGEQDDPHNAKTMIELTQNLNKNRAAFDVGCVPNCVMIHTLALSEGLSYLSEMSSISGGRYYQISNSYEFEEAIVELLTNTDMSKEIRIIKNRKMHDNPPKA